VEGDADSGVFGFGMGVIGIDESLDSRLVNRYMGDYKHSVARHPKNAATVCA
jgi:hypothetical protein